MSTGFLSMYGEFSSDMKPCFNMIDNYIYLYHTQTLIVLPTFPESIADSMPTNYSETPIMGRSAPIYSYSNSGPRSFDLQLKLHRDMMNDVNVEIHSSTSINTGTALFSSDRELIKKIQRKDYVDLLINELQSIALPSYAASEKMVNPPLVAIRIGDEIYCKGIVQGGVTCNFSGPILANPVYDENGNEQFYDNYNDYLKGKQSLTGKKLIGKGKYAIVDVSFRVTEVDPYNAQLVAEQGSFRGLDKTLERNLYKIGKI